MLKMVWGWKMRTERPNEHIANELIIHHIYNTHTIAPPSPRVTPSITLSTNHKLTRRLTCCLPSALNSETWDFSMKRTRLQHTGNHQIWAFAHLSQLHSQTTVRSKPRWGRQACKWASLRLSWQFLQVSFPETVLAVLWGQWWSHQTLTGFLTPLKECLLLWTSKCTRVQYSCHIRGKQTKRPN